MTAAASRTPDPVEVLVARCEARAILVREFYLDLAGAVDALQAAAVRNGLVSELGQDAVQAIMAEAFAAFATVDAEPDAGMRPKPHAAASAVEALMLCLRERGKAAFVDPKCRERLADLSTTQVRGVIARLIGLRPSYPAITDELLFTLGEQL